MIHCINNDTIRGMANKTAALVITDIWARPQARTNIFVRNTTLVVGFALLTAICAQIRIPLGFTPVPVTGQTFAVLLAGAALGTRLGALSQLTYWLAGLTGLPFYSNATGGWSTGTGATMGYMIGFILAAAAIGHLAELKHDRKFITSLPAMLLGSTIIYICGATWLAHSLNIALATGDKNAISLGVAPFLIGDLFKMLLAAVSTSTIWRLIKE